MDLIKQYIIQSISAASNNLRLSTQKIEIVALLRESIAQANNLEHDIKEMKKITELSKFAIRLHEIYNYLVQPHIDFFKLSDKFKEHSQYLIKDLSSLLENVNPPAFKSALCKMHPEPASGELSPAADKNIIIDLSLRAEHSITMEKSETEAIKGKIILDDASGEDEEFHNYEMHIMDPVKPLDNYLQKIESGDYEKETVAGFINKIKNNAELSLKQGFDLIAGMHNVIADSLELITLNKLSPSKNTIECIRACLIVIVAVVRGKELDITGYLNRAEEFGKDIQNLK